MNQTNKTIKPVNLNILLSSLFLGYVMVYIDKLSVGISIVAISQDIPMSDTTKGLILSSFFIGYALMQIPMSFAINKFGSKAVILWSVVLIGCFDYFFSLSSSINMLIAIRLLTGMLAHSGYASASSKEVIENFPKEKRTFAKGILISSSGVAGILTPLFLSPVIDKHGWKSAYSLITVIALLIAIIIAFNVPNNKVRKADRKKQESVSLTVILKNPNIWILFLSAFFINNLLYGLNSWLPTFLTSQRNISLTQSGFIGSIIGLFALTGAIGGSYVIGNFFQQKDKLAIEICSLVGAIFTFSSYFVRKPIFFILLLGLATLFLTISFVTLMAIPLKVFEGPYFAPSYSTISTGGIIGGAVAQLVIGSLVESSGTFLTAFIYFLILGILTSISIMFLDKK